MQCSLLRALPGLQPLHASRLLTERAFPGRQPPTSRTRPGFARQRSAFDAAARGTARHVPARAGRGGDPRALAQSSARRASISGSCAARGALSVAKCSLPRSFGRVSRPSAQLCSVSQAFEARQAAPSERNSGRARLAAPSKRNSGRARPAAPSDQGPRWLRQAAPWARDPQFGMRAAPSTVRPFGSLSYSSTSPL